MKGLLAGALCVVLSCPVFAQSNERQEAIEQFSKDLASLQASLSAPSRDWPTSGGTGLALITQDAVARASPDTSSAAIAHVEEGSTVRLVGSSGEWSEILVGGAHGAQAGWVTDDSIQTTVSLRGDALEHVIREANSLLERYKSNPYVRVSGFSAELSLTGPSLSVQFEFK